MMNWTFCGNCETKTKHTNENYGNQVNLLADFIQNKGEVSLRYMFLQKKQKQFRHSLKPGLQSQHKGKITFVSYLP